MPFTDGEPTLLSSIGSQDGKTPIHLACASEESSHEASHEVVAALIAAGANIEEKDNVSILSVMGRISHTRSVGYVV
jgi:ankyrin repeat protein